MRTSDSVQVRLWALALSLATLAATLLVVRVNPLEVGAAYLALLAGTTAVGLMTNVWGGLMASAVSAFALIWFDRYAGVYPHEDTILNVASELTVFLLVGPLAGGLATTVERMQRRAAHWLARAEELDAHDEVLGALKPEWATVRLEEEITRAVRFGRPLAAILIQVEPNPEAPIEKRGERVAVLQTLIRLARAATQPPSVIAHAGGDRVLLILPEHTAGQAQSLVGAVQERWAHERYFPGEEPQSLGKPVNRWGQLGSGLVSLDGQPRSAEAFLAQAEANLEK